jgi:hypothetical protein
MNMFFYHHVCPSLTTDLVSCCFDFYSILFILSYSILKGVSLFKISFSSYRHWHSCLT